GRRRCQPAPGLTPRETPPVTLASMATRQYPAPRGHAQPSKRSASGYRSGTRSSTSVANRAAFRIRRLIVDRNLGPNDKLPSERELTLILGVSRTSVHAAFAVLAATGVIEISPRRGAFVANDRAVGITTSVLRWFEANRLTLSHLTEFRRALEPAAAAAAAECRSEVDLSMMGTQIAAMRTAASKNEALRYAEADAQFHNQIAVASQNPLFIAMLQSL